MRVYITIISVMSKFNFQNGNPKQCRHMYSGKIEGSNLAEKKQGYFHKKALNSERNNSFSAPRLNIKVFSIGILGSIFFCQQYRIVESYRSITIL
jgi:hypothetical protein